MCRSVSTTSSENEFDLVVAQVPPFCRRNTCEHCKMLLSVAACTFLTSDSGSDPGINLRLTATLYAYGLGMNTRNGEHTTQIGRHTTMNSSALDIRGRPSCHCQLHFSCGAATRPRTRAKMDLHTAMNTYSLFRSFAVRVLPCAHPGI